MNNMTIEEEWLSQILGNSTRLGYKRALFYFKEFMNEDSTKNLILIRKRERNFETRIIQFYQWLQNKKEITSNSARAYCIALQSLFSYVGFPLKLKHKLPKTHMKIETWRPSLEDIQKVYRLGDIAVKSWISLSRDIPARISDMLKISNKQIQSGEFLLLSKKESVIGKCYVSEESQNLFTQLENAKIILPTTQAGIDKMISSACHIAGLPKRLNQHLLRKYWISTAINLGIPEIVYKILCFKSVPSELLTYYLDREDLKDSWQKVVNVIPLEAKTNGRISSIQESLDLVMKVLRTIIEKEMAKEGIRILRRRQEEITDRDILEEYLEGEKDEM